MPKPKPDDCDGTPDDCDDLDWDRQRDGRMADYAVEPEDEITTEPYEPDGEDN